MPVYFLIDLSIIVKLSTEFENYIYFSGTGQHTVFLGLQAPPLLIGSPFP